MLIFMYYLCDVVVFVAFFVFVLGFCFCICRCTLIAFVHRIPRCVQFSVHCSSCRVCATFADIFVQEQPRKISLFTETHKNLVLLCVHACVCASECSTICAESITRRSYRWMQYCCCWRFCHRTEH